VWLSQLGLAWGLFEDFFFLFTQTKNKTSTIDRDCNRDDGIEELMDCIIPIPQSTNSIGLYRARFPHCPFPFPFPRQKTKIPHIAYLLQPIINGLERHLYIYRSVEDQSKGSRQPVLSTLLA
jgi:hypothetical protein